MLAVKLTSGMTLLASPSVVIGSSMAAGRQALHETGDTVNGRIIRFKKSGSKNSEFELLAAMTPGNIVAAVSASWRAPPLLLLVGRTLTSIRRQLNETIFF